MRANRLISAFHFKYLPLFGGNFVLPVTPGYAAHHPGLQSVALSELKTNYKKSFIFYAVN